MATDTRFLALLRGINVGGRNIIAKDDLRASFEDLGFRDVRTYIQSGNILFRSEPALAKDLIRPIEEGLSARFGYEAQVVVLSRRDYRAVLRAAPDGWGVDERQKHNACFTLSGLRPAEVIARLPAPVERLESVTPGPGVIFWSIDEEQQTRTSYAKLAAARVYRQLTIRNHQTVFKLRDLFETL